MKPNYNNYSIDQLNDSLRSIDQEKYLERFNQISEQLQEKISDADSVSKAIPSVVENPDVKKIISPNQVFLGSYFGVPFLRFLR